MTELPKIVVNRLAGRDVRPDAAAHPDADLLTAFVERALGDRERGLVVSHLAECAPCRDIVSFAQPDAAEAPAAVFTPKPFWSGKLLWRWGALAACAVLAVALAVHRSGNHTAMVAEQRNAGPLSYKQTGKPSPSVANESHVDQDSLVVPESLSAEPRVPPLRVEPAAPVMAQAPVSAVPQRDESKGLIAGNTVIRSDVPAPNVDSKVVLRRDSDVDQTTTDYAYSAPKSEIAPNSELALKKDQTRAREATGGAPAAAAPAIATTVAQNAPAQASVEVSTTTAYAPTEKDEFRASSAPITSVAKAKLSAARPAATWQITDGNLQRSFDGGKSWESVSLNQPVRARVVATVRFHVWVGANGGLLFHSIDGGEHFVAVKVSDKQAVLTGDIVALAFADAQHGRLETAAHEVWTTADSGQTWNRP